MDTKTSLIVILIVGSILYFSYTTSSAQAEEIRTLRRTLETLRLLLPVNVGAGDPNAPHAHGPQGPQGPLGPQGAQGAPGALRQPQHGQPPDQGLFPDVPHPAPGGMLSNAARIPLDVGSVGAIGQRPASGQLQQPITGPSLVNPQGYGIGAGLGDDPSSLPPDLPHYS